MLSAQEKLLKCFDKIRLMTDFVPEIAIVLGSGLGSFADEIDIVKTINYDEIEYFPKSTVNGHKGRFVLGYVKNKPVMIMQGRVHYYEGYDISDVVLGIRVMYLMGAKKLILTNAAGGVNESFSKGVLMAINDHISTFVPSPLRGENIKMLGTRFPDMTNVYDKDYIKLLKECAKNLCIDLREGVYFQVPGPNYETPAEIRMIRTLGADATGMSTACEAVAAKHMGMRILAISCITNMAAGMGEILSHQDVAKTANRVSNEFKMLLQSIIEKM